MSNKTGSWSPDETREVVESYDNGNGKTVKEIAQNTGRSTRSVQGKLTAEKVYIPPVKVIAAKKDDGPTKGEYLTSIKATGRFIEVDGLNGATKAALKEVLALASA